MHQPFVDDHRGTPCAWIDPSAGSLNGYGPSCIPASAAIWLLFGSAIGNFRSATGIERLDSATQGLGFTVEGKSSNRKAYLQVILPRHVCVRVRSGGTVERCCLPLQRRSRVCTVDRWPLPFLHLDKSRGRKGDRRTFDKHQCQSLSVQRVYKSTPCIQFGRSEL